jgi:regulator of sirC expression with transglutaminase-like and TPR domain
LRVKVEEKGKITCFVNDVPAIEVIDESLVSGRVGLCKFRSPTAEFRNFKQARRIPSSVITQETRQKVRKITRNLAKLDRLPNEDYDRLIKLGNQVPQALLDQASLLKKQSLKLNKLSKNIRERLSIDELARSLAHEDENSVDLLRSALLIARLENPDFNLEAYLKKADNLAQQISSHFPQQASGEEKLKIMVHQLFQEMGFHGSTLDYSHPSNSYMNEVMDDREGLPITLSVLFIELANRLDLPVRGLGLPGHFIAVYSEKVGSDSKEILIDPFGGKIVTRKEAAEIVGLELSERDFIPAKKKDIVTRMIRNLIHFGGSDEGTASRILYIDAILAIDPSDRYTRAMRAMLNYGKGDYYDAMQDIDLLISGNPDSPELAPLLEIRNRLLEKNVR